MHIDVTGSVTELVHERLRAHAEAEDKIGQMAQAWLTFGLDREAVEKAMTARSAFSASKGAPVSEWKTAKAAVREAVQKRVAGGEADPFGRRFGEATAMLASLVWASAVDVLDPA